MNIRQSTAPEHCCSLAEALPVVLFFVGEKEERILGGLAFFFKIKTSWPFHLDCYLVPQPNFKALWQIPEWQFLVKQLLGCFYFPGILILQSSLESHCRDAALPIFVWAVCDGLNYTSGFFRTLVTDASYFPVRLLFCLLIATRLFVLDRASPHPSHSLLPFHLPGRPGLPLSETSILSSLVIPLAKFFIFSAFQCFSKTFSRFFLKSFCLTTLIQHNPEYSDSGPV